jgi:hypothetical protein
VKGEITEQPLMIYQVEGWQAGRGLQVFDAGRRMRRWGLCQGQHGDRSLTEGNLRATRWVA